VNLLESYIKTVLETYLLEAASGVATPRDPPEESQEFNLDQLKQPTSLPQVFGYVERTLGNARIGQGQGRNVYRLPGGKVLKLARNPGGIGQNQAEATVCKNDATADIFPGIFEVGPEFIWIIAEEAQPMNRVKFGELTGVPWSEFLFAIGGAFPSSIKNPTKSQLAQFQHAFEKHYANKFFRRVINLVKDCKYEPGDIAKLDSWGIVRGRPVIVDSGFTEAVHKSHYQG
jgi:hypothetical protein